MKIFKYVKEFFLGKDYVYPEPVNVDELAKEEADRISEKLSLEYHLKSEADKRHRFSFGDKVNVEGYEDSLFLLIPKEGTEYFVCNFDDSSMSDVPVYVRRNGIDKTFWIPRKYLSKYGNQV